MILRLGSGLVGGRSLMILRLRCGLAGGGGEPRPEKLDPLVGAWDPAGLRGEPSADGACRGVPLGPAGAVPFEGTAFGRSAAAGRFLGAGDFGSAAAGPAT